jgi:FAD/FMN-containing dehydrogenase
VGAGQGGGLRGDRPVRAVRIGRSTRDDHAPPRGREIGELGVDVLRAVKRELDPTGVLNPGKLVS